MNTKAFFPCAGGPNLILGIGRENQIFFLKTPAAVKIFSKNCQKMTFWCKINSLPTQMHLCNSYRVPHTILQGNYNFQRSTNKIIYLMKFPDLEKIVNLMKDLKYEHQSTFSLWEGSNLMLGIYRETKYFSENSSCCQVFSQKCQKMTFWCKKINYPPRCICITHIGCPTLFLRVKIIFQGVLTKFFFFLMKFAVLEKIFD